MMVTPLAVPSTTRPSRIVVVQGPTQMLAALAVLHHLKSTIRDVKLRDVLVLGGMYVDGSARALSRITGATRAIAGSWCWDQIYDLSDMIPTEVEPNDLDRLAAQVRSVFYSYQCDQLLLVRNYQAVNECLIRAFPNAKLSVYGDGFGELDSKRGARYRAPEDAYLTMPVVSRRATVGTTRVHILDKEVTTRLIDETALRLVRDGLIPELPFPNGRRTVLALLSYFADLGWMTLADEIQMYCAMIHQEIEPGSVLYVKPHPRETLGQHQLVADHFRARGYDVFELSMGLQGALPVEVLIRVYRFDAVCATFSASAGTLKYFFGITPRVASLELLTQVSPRGRRVVRNIYRYVSQVQRCVEAIEESPRVVFLETWRDRLGNRLANAKAALRVRTRLRTIGFLLTRLFRRPMGENGYRTRLLCSQAGEGKIRRVLDQRER